MGAFRWNDWNLEHATRHGVNAGEAEAVVRYARPPYPRKAGDGKWLVRGHGIGRRYLQVVFVYDDDQVTAYILHARPLTDKEKRLYRRRSR